MRTTACMVACAPLQASVLFWRRRLGSYHSRPLLGGRRKPKKRHARNSDGDAAIIHVLSYPLSFWSLRLVVVALGRSSWWQNWACDRHVFFLGATAGVRCAMICSREHGCCPGRHSLRSTIYRLGGVCRYCPHSYDGLPRRRWPSENMPCKLDEILHFKSNSSSEGVYYPGITRTRYFCEFCTPKPCLLYTSPSPRDKRQSRMPSSA